MSRMFTRALLLVLAAFVIPSRSPAQEARFELGQRLRAFEVEWDRVTDEAARKRTLPHLKQATASFFTFNLPEAVRGLDLARLALGSEKEPDPAVLWAESCIFKPTSRLLASGEDLSFSV